MPKDDDDQTAKGHSEGAPGKPAGGSYGDQQPQYGTAGPDGQEPIPGRDERGEFGAGGEAFGSASGQGRYGAEDQARKVKKPQHPAWQPFGQPEANHPAETKAGQPRNAPLDPQYRDWGDRAMRRHDEEYRAFRAERQNALDAEFEEWRKARRAQAATPPSSKS